MCMREYVFNYHSINTELELFNDIKFASLSSAQRWFVNSNFLEDDDDDDGEYNCLLLGVEALELEKWWDSDTS